MKDSARTTAVRGKGWKRALNIPQDKYRKVSGAILKVLTARPVRFGELAGKVRRQVGKFPGSVEWYMVGTLRQLEKEGKVARTKGKIVTYSIRKQRA